ncbi:MAG: hypothetical protein ABJC10_06365 [Acidobacteriota bacterium]
MAGNKHNGNGRDPRHVTETPNVSHIKNLDVTHEASDVNISGIVKFVMGLTVLGVVVFVLMGAMFRFLNWQESVKEPQPGPMAMTEQERLPPEPRLQAAKGFGVKLEDGRWVNLENREPEAEYRVLREQWDQRLNCKNEEGSQAVSPNCVSIDVAMEKVLEGGGLGVRTTPDNLGALEDVSPPTAWSSGRLTRARKGSE